MGGTTPGCALSAGFAVCAMLAVAGSIVSARATPKPNRSIVRVSTFLRVWHGFIGRE
jgi:hypothetical protein